MACDELGAALHPEWLTDEFHRLAATAAVPRIWLHDTRGSMNGLLERQGVSDSLRAAWLGHAVTVNRSAYVGVPQPGELAAVSAEIGRLCESA